MRLPLNSLSSDKLFSDSAISLKTYSVTPPTVSVVGDTSNNLISRRKYSFASLALDLEMFSILVISVRNCLATNFSFFNLYYTQLEKCICRVKSKMPYILLSDSSLPPDEEDESTDTFNIVRFEFRLTLCKYSSSTKSKSFKMINSSSNAGGHTVNLCDTKNVTSQDGDCLQQPVVITRHIHVPISVLFLTSIDSSNITSGKSNRCLEPLFPQALAAKV
ncbi:hypothetical protein AGLY_003756 [Aphis glycines]|uniref:Uncharacterized protein n=1 Tax=Aphis glycines TaxID=307491 RepID=A0A6G0TZI2_APHGL|nr:hypothetical protein AGLY_003756 [Aphis glycines]